MLKTIVWAACAALLCQGCSEAPLHAQLSKLRDYSVNEESVEPFPPPSLAIYEKNGKKLVFLASKHEADPHGPTHRTVALALIRYKPQLVILEGLQNSAGPSPDWFPAHPNDCFTNGPSSCEETDYAAVLSRRTKTEYVGGEPDERDIYASLAERDFDANDLIAFYVLRQIPQWQREGALAKKSLAELTQDLIRYYEKVFNVDTHLDLPAVQEWYQRHMGHALDLQKFTTEDIAPLDGPGSTYIQKVSVKISRRRELSLARLIETSINEHDVVLVVYGSGHLVEERVMLEDMFGPPTDLKLF